MRRLLLFAVLLALAIPATCAAYRAFASDATRIRWLFADEAAAFNGCAALSVLESFAPDYRDETAGVSRHELRAGLIWSFQNRRHPKTRRFLHRVALGEVAVEVEGERARATVPLVLHHGLDAGERAVWEVRVFAELARKDGAWRVERSRHETVRGGVPR